MAVEAIKVPVPQCLKTPRNADTLACPNLLSRYACPAFRARRNVIYAPIADPMVATMAYSYQGLRRVETRMATRMSGPPKVGTGELSRIVRKKSPNAPRWRNTEKTVRPRGAAVWSRRFNMSGEPSASCDLLSHPRHHGC